MKSASPRTGIHLALSLAIALAGTAVVFVRAGDDTVQPRATASSVEQPVAAPDVTDPLPPAKRPRPGIDRAMRAPRSVSYGADVIPPRPGDFREEPGPEPAVSAGPLEPMDFIAARATLSTPLFREVSTTVHRIAAHDDVQLYVEVIRPDPEVHGEGPWPVIMEASPYHGTIYDRDGRRMIPDRGPDGRSLGLTGYFVPRGYAVVMLDLRGTGRSQGCLDHLGPNDAADIKRIVEWSADQPWSNGRVALTGHSYPGGATVVAIAQQPRGLVTAVPSASLGSMYDHQFQWGVPYNLQWAGPIFAYEDLAMCRHLPACATSRGGDNFGNDMRYFGCGWANSAALAGTGQVNGQYQNWHAVRDHRADARAADIPIFMIHGVNDNAARIPAAEWFFGGRFDRPGDKVWIGQWDHGSGSSFHPNQRWDQWTFALHAWFDKHLKQLDVDTGPAVEAFLNGERVATAPSWSEPTDYLEFFPGGTELTREPGDNGSITFQPPAAGSSRSHQFISAPMPENRVLLGLAELRLRVSMAAGSVMHLAATLTSEARDGRQEHVATCTIQPQLREGTDRTVPVTPGQAMDLDLQCFTVAHHLKAGHTLVLSLGTTSAHHVGFPGTDRITVHTGPDASILRLPVAPSARTWDDVPLRLKAPAAE